MMNKFINKIFLSLISGTVIGVFAYWISSLTMPWLTKTQLKSIIPGFMVIGFALGLIEAVRLHVRTASEILAVYVEAYRIFMCNTSKGNITCASMTTLIDPAIALEKQLISVLTPVRKRLKLWPPILLILTLPCDSPELSAKFLHKAAARLRCNLYVFDFRMCCALGIGLDVSAYSKRLLVIAAINTVHVFILFADGLFYETINSTGSEPALSHTIEVAILDLKKRFGKDLPSKFQRKMFSDEEYNQILAGWRRPFSEDVHVVSTAKKTSQFRLSVIDHNVILHDNFEEIIKAGLSKIAIIMSRDKS